jgi:hypothetical protein
MEIEYQDIVTLSDNNKYVVASKAKYNDNDYVYLVDINNPSNLKIMRVEKDSCLVELDLEKDKDILTKLVPLFYKNSKKDIEGLFE